MSKKNFIIRYSNAACELKEYYSAFAAKEL